MLNHAYRSALDAANYFRSIGLVPLPSCMKGERKQPMIDYKDLRSKPVPGSVYTDAGWTTTNIQIMTGVETVGATKIAVIDLDGHESIDAWSAICNRNGCSTRDGYPWISSTGSGGYHWYYRLPEGTKSCTSRLIWGLYDTLVGWLKHKEIRLLGDKSLVVAPPSARIDGKGSYRWADGHGPARIPLPGYAPAWLLAMPGWVAPERQHYDQPKSNYKNESHDGGLRQKVLNAIPPVDKVRLAQSWGLRFAESHPRITDTWISCRSIYREDKIPSAGFNAQSGVYNEVFAGGAKQGLSLFDLAARLGVYRTWREALDALADKYLK